MGLDIGGERRMENKTVIFEFSGLTSEEIQELISEKFSNMEKGGLKVSVLSEEGSEKVNKMICGKKGMKMTREQFFKWANQQVQTVENELLEPKNKRVADEEIVEVLTWDRFAHIAYELIEGRIEIVEED